MTDITFSYRLTVGECLDLRSKDTDKLVMRIDVTDIDRGGVTLTLTPDPEELP